MKKRSLFNDDEEDEGDNQDSLHVNEAFAKKYEERKTKEMLSNKRAFSLFTDKEDEDQSSEDEYAEELTPVVDEKIQETIRMIRERDPRIYDASFQPFSNLPSTESTTTKKEKTSKPVTYSDMIRSRAEHGRVLDDSDDDDDNSMNEKPLASSYFEQTEKAKKEFQLAAEKELAFDHYTVKPGLQGSTTLPAISVKEEEFLWNYVNDRHAWTADALPQNHMGRKPLLENDEDEDEKELEKAEQFEQEFVFRHLDPNATKIVTHARQIEGSLRRKDNSRKLKRDEVQNKKNEEEELKRAELKRLRNLKRKMMEKELMEAFGSQNEEVLKKFQVEDLEADFDPDTWDKKMSQVFDDDYYKQSDEELHVEDDDDDGEGEEEEEHVEEEKAVKKKTLPLLPPNKTTIKRLVEDRLSKEEEEKNEEETEDADSGLKFRYRKVEPNDYGLDELEILQATNQELNAFVGLKRLAPYADREWHAGSQHRKRFRDKLKERQRELAQPRSKKEIKQRKIGKNRFEKAAAATESAAKTTMPFAVSSKRLQSFGQ